ncbi:MAG: SPOR domain-containing protein [Cyclobacteriaceae bacterium]
MKGFGAQLGTYQELANLLRITHHLKNTYKKKVIIQVKVITGVKYYSLNSGPFSSQQKASDFVRNLGSVPLILSLSIYLNNNLLC